MKDVIIIGDSFNNTLGVIRSCGRAGAKVIFILVGHDRLFVSRSRYVSEVFRCQTLDDCEPILESLALSHRGATLICSNDKAAKWVDERECELSKIFLTPCRGKQIGDLFEKDAQCRLARDCGFTVPRSELYERGERFPELDFPILMKPADSNHGEKSDIHICRSIGDVEEALSHPSCCNRFIVQEFIEKEYELNAIGIATERGIIVPGAVRKIRHYPDIYSPCSFGQYRPLSEFDIDIKAIEKFIEQVGYYGPFSVEFLHKGSKNYFMEFNFRNDGLAYVATVAGANLPELYLTEADINKPVSIRPTYMMDLSTDFCHVKSGTLSRGSWLKDYIRTCCQLNFSPLDPLPTLLYYKAKLLRH